MRKNETVGDNKRNHTVSEEKHEIHFSLDAEAFAYYAKLGRPLGKSAGRYIKNMLVEIARGELCMIKS